MKIGNFFKILNFLIFFIIIALLFSSNYMPRFSAKEIRKMENKALLGNFDLAMKLADYYGVDLQDSLNERFWNCICFENEPSEGSWNFSQINYMEDGKSLRYQYCIFLSEETEIKNTSSELFEIIKQRYINFHKKYPDFKFSDDNLEYNVVTDENYQYFHDKAFSGSGLAALKIAEFYEKKIKQNVYANYTRFLDVGCVYNLEEENFPLFWYRIGAQNGNKECMKEYAALLKQSTDEYDNIRAKFWEKKAKK